MSTIYDKASGSLLAAVEAVEPHTEADPLGVLAALISMTSAAIGGGPRVEIGVKKHPLLVWTLLLGDTGKGRKGTASGMAERILNEAYPGFLKNHKVTGVSSGAGLIASVANRRERALKEMAEAEEEGTVYEGIKPNDLRQMVVEEEWVAVMRRSARDATLSGTFRQAWDGGVLATITAKNNGGLSVEGAHIAIHGHATPREFRACLQGTDVAGGTYNRFLIFKVARSRRLPIGHSIPDHLVTAAATALRVGIEFARKVERVGLTPGAQELLNGWLIDDIEAWGDNDPAMESFATRGVDQVLRIGALYALMDQRRKIDVKDVTAAWAFVEASFEAVSAITAPGADSDLPDVVLKLVMKAGAEGLKRSELNRKLGRRANPAPAIDAALKELPEIRIFRVAGAGRTADVYVWGPLDEEVEPPEGGAPVPPIAPPAPSPTLPAARSEGPVKQSGGRSLRTSPPRTPPPVSEAIHTDDILDLFG